MRPGRLATALVGAATLVAGCGLPTDGDPQQLATDDLPADLIEPPEDDAERPLPPSETIPIDLYFDAGEETLVLVTRAQPAQANLANVVQTLLDGPTEDERDTGLSTAIPVEWELLDAELTVDTGVAALDLDTGETALTGDELRRAFAQLVLTITLVDGVASVRFLENGEPTEVPIDDGTSEGGTVTRSDYRSLEPLE